MPNGVETIGMLWAESGFSRATALVPASRSSSHTAELAPRTSRGDVASVDSPPSSPRDPLSVTVCDQSVDPVSVLDPFNSTLPLPLGLDHRRSPIPREQRLLATTCAGPLSRGNSLDTESSLEDRLFRGMATRTQPLGFSQSSHRSEPLLYQ